jgi:hypothetical protein
MQPLKFGARAGKETGGEKGEGKNKASARFSSNSFPQRDKWDIQKYTSAIGIRRTQANPRVLLCHIVKSAFKFD